MSESIADILKSSPSIGIPEELKPGVKTSELYVAVGSQIIALLVLLGVLSTVDAAMVNSWIVEAVEKGGALLLLGMTTWQYIKSRTAVKGG